MYGMRRTHLFLFSTMLIATLTSSIPVAHLAGSKGVAADSDEPPLAAALRLPEATASRSKLNAFNADPTTTTSTTVVAPTTTVPPAPPTTSTTSKPKPEPTVHAARAVSPTPATVAAAPVPAAAPQASSSSMASFILNAINGERAARGISPMHLDGTLTNMSQSWSKTMATAGAMSHSGSGIPSGFNAFGENVLTAGGSSTAGSMYNLWFGSSGHRANMLQPGFDSVGIAAACVNGKVYATESFGHSSSAGDANLSSGSTDATQQKPISGGPAAC